jgi:hypothetical protein
MGERSDVMGEALHGNRKRDVKERMQGMGN